MASSRIADALPPVPSSLKVVTPYIQRADELRAKDPVMAYWCTYYAAQLGLDMKSQEPGARDYLLGLITLLERMKKDIGANDAVDHEAAGAAYVENFALKVFAMADNEDRKGEATRSTAKKFLAAAHFLELLRVFEKSDNAQVNEDKVRYSKWKASDIAKAYREGRRPTPGSAEDLNDETLESSSKTAISPSTSSTVPLPTTHSGGDPSTSPNPADVDGPHTPPRKNRHSPPNLQVPPPDITSPGSWSTVATPGSDIVGLPSASSNMTFTSAMNRWKGPGDVEESPLRAKGAKPDGVDNGDSLRKMSNAASTSSVPSDLPLKKVHFSPSVVGGLSSAGGSPPLSPDFGQRISSSFASTLPPEKSQPLAVPSGSRGSTEPTMAPLPDSSPSTSSRASMDGASPPNSAGPRAGTSPPGPSTSSRRLASSPPSAGPMLGSSPPSANGPKLGISPPGSSRFSAPPSAPAQARGHERRVSLSKRSPPQVPGALHPVPPPPPPANASYSSSTTSSTFVSTSHPSITFDKSPNPKDGYPVPAPPPGGQAAGQPYYKAFATNAPTFVVPAPAPVELTPALIAKAQKHCRYAISSLEYEDAEQARKELHAALALLGEK